MTTPIQPTAIYPPGGNPSVNYGAWSQANPSGFTPPKPPGRVTRAYSAIPAQQRQVKFKGPVSVPPFLSNRSIVFNAWLIAMILIGFDEWHNLGILPRPARLWNTSLVYGLLMMLSFVDPMVPIANALAIGFDVALLYQYYQGDLTPAGGPQTTQSAVAQAQATIQPVGYSGIATVPSTGTTGANPTGGAPTQTGA